MDLSLGQSGRRSQNEVRPGSDGPRCPRPESAADSRAPQDNLTQKRLSRAPSARAAPRRELPRLRAGLRLRSNLGPDRPHRRPSRPAKVCRPHRPARLLRQPDCASQVRSRRRPSRRHSAHEPHRCRRCSGRQPRRTPLRVARSNPAPVRPLPHPPRPGRKTLHHRQRRVRHRDQGVGTYSLFPTLAPHPQHRKHRQRHHQHQHSRGKTNIPIAVGITHRVMTHPIPRQQREDGNRRRRKKREECRRKRQQQAGEQAKTTQRKSEDCSALRASALFRFHQLESLRGLEYKFMASSAQVDLWPAEKVATQVAVAEAPNGIHYAMWGETRISDADLERLVSAVPAAFSAALQHRAYYFVPLAIADTDATRVAPGYTVDLGDRAICHRNADFGSTQAVFLSPRLVEDRFGLAFEFFINVAHNFVEAAGVPDSFSTLAWQQAEAQVRGETSQDAWETRRRAQDVRIPDVRNLDSLSLNGKTAQMPIDERARSAFFESAFSDALAIYMLSLAVDFDYHDLRERDYPLLAAPALAERLRHVATLFPANQGYEFQVLYRRKG